ncbi:thioesterase family protein [Flavobacterium sp. ASW18X]|uniref:acyl-CoA thioesterase n=1 Tax=Flavobacterium sp. ASW18X TaxID=2572595 RepID=UPI0010AE62E2|nr:thioesterase family protein [Flavobacterium sp. ASW18X]TKD65828.1 acyl-CoA thioesterase [Flavobacterium sp. ASW18X]
MNFNTCSFRVRYGETDQMGVVYHGKYADYLEVGRVEWLRALGVSYKTMEEDGVMLPVINLQILYKKSAKYDDLITVKTILRKVPGVRIIFDYEIYNENKELLVEASTTLVFMDKLKMKPIKCPGYILDKLRG